MYVYVIVNVISVWQISKKKWKAIGFYSSSDKIEEILDGSPTSATFASHRSAHFLGLFLVSGRVSSRYRYRMKRNPLSCVSCIATVSSNTYPLHSAPIVTHTITYSHIHVFFSETKHCYSRSDVRSQLIPFSAIPRSWTWKCAKLYTLKIRRKLTTIATTIIFSQW